MTQHTDRTPLTDEQLDEITARAGHLFEYVTMPTEADQLAGVDVPALIAEVRRLQAQRKFLIDQLTKRDAASGAADAAVRAFLAGEVPEPHEKPARPSEALLAPAGHPIADADNPTPLRWGLNDVLYGDDDTVIVMLSGPDREPYWLELDEERAAVLRQDLAGPGGEETDTLPAWLYQRFMTDGEGWDNLDADQRSYWEHQARAVRRAIARNGFKAAAEEPFTGTRSCGHDDYHDPHEWADRPGVWCPGIGYDDEETAR